MLFDSDYLRAQSSSKSEKSRALSPSLISKDRTMAGARGFIISIPVDLILWKLIVLLVVLH